MPLPAQRSAGSHRSWLRIWGVGHRVPLMAFLIRLSIRYGPTASRKRPTKEVNDEKMYLFLVVMSRLFFWSRRKGKGRGQDES